MNKQEAIEEVTELFGDSIQAKAFRNIIRKLHEPQKVVVPQVAVDYYEQYKDRLTGFDEWFDDFYDGGFRAEFPQGEKLTEWLYDNDDDTNRQRELALATLIVNGPGAVEVEQEKLYTVELFNGQPLVEANNVLYFSSNLAALNARVSKDKLEEAGFGWVFDCKGVKVVEMER